MDDYTKMLILLDQGDFSEKQALQLFELCLSRISIDTIQGMAKSEGKSYNGIKTSNRYKKINIGKQKFAIKGVSETNLPF